VGGRRRRTGTFLKGHLLARILVVDDEDSVRYLLQLVFEVTGHDVLLAVDGDEGIEVARRERPDVIVLDVMMPRMDGATAFGELKADLRTKAIPILVLTAAPLSAVTVELFRSGAARVMRKPFDPADVVTAVNDLVSGADRQEESTSRPTDRTAR
jgi:CheY-like chemotaxis protein